MIDLSMMRDIVAIFGVIAGFTYYVITVRNAQKTRELTLKAQEHTLETRETQLFMSIFNKFTSREFTKAFERILSWEFTGEKEFHEKYGWFHEDGGWKREEDIDFDDSADFNMVLNWFEGLGVLMRRGLISSELVFEIMYGGVGYFYRKVEPMILELRERTGNEVLRDLEYVYREVQRLRDESDMFQASGVGGQN